MNILVDTSVWYESLRRKKNTIQSEELFLTKLINNEEHIIIIGIIFQEILSGITNTKLFNQIQNILYDFSYIEPTKVDYINAAKLKNHCQTNGISAGSIDYLIASIVINNDIVLATYDKDFYNISSYSELRILNEKNY